MKALDKVLKRNRLFFSFIIASVSFSLSFFIRLYCYSDDYYLAMILNCIYSSDNYCLFVSPILCAIVKFLHDILPFADCYMLLVRIAYFFSMWLIAYYTLSNKTKMFITIPILIFLSFFCEAGLTYTITTTYFICVGLFFCIGLSDNKMYHYCGFILMLFGFLLRTQSAILSLPFILLEMVSYFYEQLKEKTESKKSIKKFVKKFVPVLLCGIIILSSEVFVRFDNDYKAGIEYNSARTTVGDYPMAKWEEIEKDKQGISENDYKNIVNKWVLFDTDIITTEFLNKIGNLGSKPTYSFSIMNTYFVVVDIFSHIIMNKTSKTSLIVLLFLVSILIFSLVSKIPVNKKLKNILACLGGLLICIYFYYIGRMPERVTVSVLQYCIVSVLLSLAGRNEYFSTTNKNKIIGLTFSIILCTIAVPIMFNWYTNINSKPSFALTACIQNESSKKHYSENDIYIWNSGEMKRVTLEPLIERGKLPSKDFMDHNIVIGDWVYGQKYTFMYFSSIGITNPDIALMERPDTYYVGNDTDMLKTYLTEHYDFDKEPVNVKDINNAHVWSFQE